MSIIGELSTVFRFGAKLRSLLFFYFFSCGKLLKSVWITRRFSTLCKLWVINPQVISSFSTELSTAFGYFCTTFMMRKLRTIEMQRLSVEQFREAEKLPLVVILDDVRSMHNVGSVLRTADAFRVEQVALCGITGTPPHAEIHKTALGAEDSVAWSYHESAQEVVNHYRQQGYTVLAVEQVEHSTKLHRFKADPSKRYAVVLGNEVKGVNQAVIDHCDGCLEITQLGTKHSMNVSVTAGIIIYKFAFDLFFGQDR